MNEHEHRDGQEPGPEPGKDRRRGLEIERVSEIERASETERAYKAERASSTCGRASEAERISEVERTCEGVRAGGIEALSSVTDDELIRRLAELVSRSRRVEADLVAHIGEVDQRKLYARFAFSSMYAYCTEALHLTEAEAYRRITVARAAREHEMLLPMLRDGRLHLSGLALLVGLLTPVNRDEVLRRATHASRRDIERLVAEVKPRPDARSQIQKLPDRRPEAAGDCTPAPSESAPGDGRLGCAADAARAPASRSNEQLQADGARLRTPGEGVATSSVAQLRLNSSREELASTPSREELASTPAPDGPVRWAVVQPLSPGRHKVQFTASDELRDKLERLRALMRPEDGDLAALIECAVTEKLERLEARRFAMTRTPRQTLAQARSAPKSRYIPAAVRRAVWERDGGRCSYVDESGRRCSERHRLEFHHRVPYGMGGDHSLDNVCLLCPAHNRYRAERDYGPEVILKRRRAGTRPCQGSLVAPG